MNDILEDRAGRLWIATNGGGLARLLMEPTDPPGSARGGTSRSSTGATANAHGDGHRHHRLVRDDEEEAPWSVPSPERTLTLASLVPGRWRIDVRASASDGAGGDAPSVTRSAILERPLGAGHRAARGSSRRPMDFNVILIAVIATSLICGATLAIPGAAWLEDWLKRKGYLPWGPF